MWHVEYRTLVSGDTVWVVIYPKTGRYLQVGRRVAEPLRFDTREDARIVADAMNRASYR